MKSFIKLSNLLLVGMVGVISLPLILVSCNQETNPEPEIDPTDPIPPVVNPNPPVNPNPIPPNILEFAKGGEISYSNAPDVIQTNIKLKVDKYLAVVNQLRLDQYTNISLLTNEGLNKLLHISDTSYELLELSIIEGSSQSSGTLVLSLNGEYKDHLIENEKITISNFPMLWNKSLDVISVDNKINELNFITDLQGENFSSWTAEQFFKYNERPIYVKYSVHGMVAPIDLNKFYENGLIANMQFINPNFNNVDWDIKVTFMQKKYNGTNWVEEVSNSKTTLNKYKVKFNINHAALNVLASTAKIKEQNNNQVYASTVFLKSQKGLNPWEEYIQLDLKIKNKYFPGSTINFTNGIPTVNDKLGTLGGMFIIQDSKDVSKEPNQSFFRMTLKGFKLSSILFTAENISSNTISLIKGGAFEKSVIQDLNSTTNKPLINALTSGQSAEFNLNQFTTSFGQKSLIANANIFTNYWIDKVGTFQESLIPLTQLSNSGFEFNLLSQKTSLLSALSKDENGQFENLLFKKVVVSDKQNENLIIITKQTNGDLKISYKLDIVIDSYAHLQDIKILNETTILAADII